MSCLRTPMTSGRRAARSATRLTSGAGLETAPIFSPDGKHIAFTADYDGNLDVMS